MKVAIPLAKGTLCQHFGHCEQFAVVHVDPQHGTVLDTAYLTPPPHEPGVLPHWLADTGATLVIAGGMGARAISLLQERGVKVIIGAPADCPEKLVRAYHDGTLTLSANPCDH